MLHAAQEALASGVAEDGELVTDRERELLSALAEAVLARTTGENARLFTAFQKFHEEVMQREVTECSNAVKYECCWRHG